MEKEQHYKDQMTKALQVIRQLKQEVNTLKASPAALLNEPIAIVGMGCRYPGGVKDLYSYWELLKNGVNAITEIPKDRWDIEQYFDPSPQTLGKMYARRGGFIQDVDSFDAAFFDISPREAVSYDPSFRLMLEVAFEALENAGIPYDKIKNELVSVFVGQSVLDYEQRHLKASDPSRIDAYSVTGSFECSGVGRISYLLDLQGANMSVETGCSASLVAIHLGCQNLRNGESDMAIVGGVNAIASPHNHIALSQMSGLAVDGHCKTFDESADGFTRGDGCGMIVLKRLSDAIRDKDHIWALVRGSAINHVGRSNGPTAPSTTSQTKLIQQAIKNAGIKPEQVDFVEAHGTGTPLGDPIELEAVQKIYGKARGKQNPVIVGAVKTNFGHTEGAAGVAGLIKVVLSIQHQQIPPNLHFKNPSPHINWDGTVKIPTSLTSWEKAAGQTRLAGVSSFGIGGTNAHVIIEEVSEEIKQKIARSASKTWEQDILSISAKTPQALKAYAQKYADFLSKEKPEWTGVCAFSALHRTHFPQRLAVVAADREKAIEQLQAFAQSDVESPLALNTDDTQKVVFVFPGQGSQWVGMGRDLYARSKAFKDAIDECAKAFSPFIDWSLTEELLREGEGNRFGEIDIIQPVLIAMEIALAKLWQSVGIQPNAVVGHSMGETAAAYLSGALSLEDAGRIICERSKLMKKLSGKGAMLFVGLTIEEAGKAIEGFEKQVSIAVSNSPQSTVLSGDTDAINAIKEKLEASDVFCRLIKVNVASHSPQMDVLKEDLLHTLSPLKPQSNQVSFYSTVHSEVLDGATLSPAYWVDNLREPVMFGKTIQKLLEDGHTTFIEMTPHPVLLEPVKEIIQAGDWSAAAIPTLFRDKEAIDEFTNSLGKLYTAGFPLDWSKIYPSAAYLQLPTYPWQKKRYWLDAEVFDGSAVISSPTAYEAAEEIKESFASQLLAMPEEARHKSLKQHLKEKISAVAGLPLSDIQDNSPFKSLGIDSLMFIQLRKALEKSLGVSVSVKDFTTNPNVAACTLFIAQKLDTVNLQTVQQNQDADHDHPLYKTKEFLEKEARLPTNVTVENLVPYNGNWKHVLLTGGTGFIGAFVLASLVENTDAAVHCLVRGASGETGLERLKSNLQKYNLWKDEFSKKIVPILGDLGAKQLGLPTQQWDEMSKNVDAIFHIGAQVRWLDSYDDVMDSNVEGTRELLRLASQNKLKAIHYASTIASHASFANAKGSKIMENDLVEECDRLYGAYSQTKWVNEKMLMAARVQGIPINIYRFGDIKGSSETGIGNADDFMNSLMKATIALQASPNLSIELNIVPVDFLAECLVKFAQNLKQTGENYHFNNEEWVSWQSLIEQMESYGFTVSESNSFAEWYAKARQKALAGDENFQKLMPVFAPLGINQETQNKSYWDLASHLHDLYFDDTNTKRMLSKTKLVCPRPIGENLLIKYFDYFVASGYVENPKAEKSLSIVANHEWFDIFKPNPKATKRLFCFHYAGGSSMMYFPWAEHLSKDIELVAVQVPNRFGESDIKMESIAHIAENIVHSMKVKGMLTKPFAFFGHSMGGTVMFETARRLRSQNLALPTKYIISANPYQNNFTHQGIYKLSDKELQTLFPRLTPEVLGDEELYRLIKDTLRADLQLMDEFRFVPDAPLGLPIIALAASKDDLVDADRIKAWEAEASEFQFIVREGTHDYVHEDTLFLTNLINQELKKTKNALA